MNQQNESSERKEPTALQRLGRSVARKNGVFTWIAFVVVAAAMVVTFLRALHVLP